jgi:hypothetical protein
VINPYSYRVLDAEDQEAILQDRLHTIEVEHFKIMIEIRLARVMNTAEAEIVGAESHLAALEVQSAALAQWLGIEEPADA